MIQTSATNVSRTVNWTNGTTTVNNATLCVVLVTVQMSTSVTHATTLTSIFIWLEMCALRSVAMVRTSDITSVMMAT